MEQTAVLSIQNLRVAFKSNTGLNEVLHGISYDLFANEILGIVGESGSGNPWHLLLLWVCYPPKKVWLVW